MNDTTKGAKKECWATTKDLKEAINHIENEDKLHLEARVEIYFENRSKRFGIVEIGHFSVIPNMTLTIKEIKDNEAK